MIRWIKSLFRSKAPVINSVVDFTKTYSCKEFQERFKYCVVCDRELDWTPLYSPMRRWTDCKQCYFEWSVSYYRVSKNGIVIDESDTDGYPCLILLASLSSDYMVLEPKGMRMSGVNGQQLTSNLTTIDVKKLIKEDLDRYLVLM